MGSGEHNNIITKGGWTMESVNNIFVRPCVNCGSIKAVVSMTWYGLVVRGFRIVEGAKGLFLGMPSRKRGEEWEDVCFFVDPSAREEVTNKVLEEYAKVLAAA
jgi:DNA-binding cell septation regulator SpoVG